MNNLKTPTYCILPLVLFFAMSIFSPVLAADATRVEILQLKTGDRIPGESQGLSNGFLYWKTIHGELLKYPLDDIKSVDYPNPLAPATLKNATTTDENVTHSSFEEEAESDSHAFLQFLSPTFRSIGNTYRAGVTGFQDWTKRFEIGGRFLDGNSNQDFVNLGGKFEREMGDWEGQIDFNGQWGQTDGDVNTNRWNANITYDYSKSGNWILFVTAKNEYDEFENLDYRGTYSSGIGYRVFNEDDRRLIVRIGPAATRELFRDPMKTRTTFDTFGEVEMDWRLMDRTMLESKTTIHPSIEDLEVLRIVSNQGVYFQLDNDDQWKLKLGVRLEYNGKPNNNRDPADITSSIQLVYTRK